MGYEEFRVTVRNTREVWAQRQMLPPVSGKVEYTGLPRKTIEILKGLVGEEGYKCAQCEAVYYRNPHREEMALLGTYLYNVLFSGEVDKEFRRTYQEVKENEDLKVRVVLQFMREADELATLPWEYLFLPEEGGGNFFVALGRLILSRHVRLNIPLETLKPRESKLRILFVVSQPKGWNVVDADKIINAVEALRKKEFPNTIEIERIDQPTKDSFDQALRTKRPHVLHFFGHGLYREGSGHIVFVGKEGDAPPLLIPDRDFADFFEEVKPRLVFLQACQGAQSDSFQVFSGVALQLVTKNIPAVVGMQYSIPNKAANLFAATFYGSLAKGLPIDDAVQDGRRKIGLFLDETKNWSSRDFGSPVLYLQSKDYLTEQRIILAQETGPKSDAGGLLCPHCSEEVTLNSKFCATCGQPIMFCSLGHVSKPSSRFCQMCGEVLGQGPVARPSASPGERFAVISGGEGAAGPLPPETGAPGAAPAGRPLDRTD